jgi:hypothetical protein
MRTVKLEIRNATKKVPSTRRADSSADNQITAAAGIVASMANPGTPTTEATTSTTSR